MEILAHRGYWREPIEKNSLGALSAAFERGYGIETDVRDLDGKLVISHDIPKGTKNLSFEEVLGNYAACSSTTTLAINIKSDGLQTLCLGLLETFKVKNYFVFDMSIPDCIGYLGKGIKTYIRRSDIEEFPALMKRGQGVWLDEMLSPWVDADTILGLLQATPKVCIVSPELHSRPYLPLWEAIAGALRKGADPQRLQLCTDNPDAASEYFKFHD